MLTPIIAPTTSNLMAPETVLARLKLPESALDDLTEEVAEASGLVARYLRYRPEYGTWQETFHVASDRLYLSARPAWSVESVAYRDGSVQATDSYLLDRGPFGESSIRRGSGQWSYWWPAEYEGSLRLSLSSAVVEPDWTVQYTAGWWLEDMGPTPPAGVDPLPPEIKADFLKIVRWLRATNSSIPGVRRMKDDGAEVEFFSAGEQDVDPLTGLPNRCTQALSLYRRAA